MLLDRKQVAALLGIGRTRLFDLIAFGALPPAPERRGRVHLWPISLVERYIELRRDRS
jgi:predicted DNA-binding transcriptional regulator AlpA